MLRNDSAGILRFGGDNSPSLGGVTVLGALLTGGLSTRMGTDKSDVMVGDRTMLERSHQSLSEVADEVVLLGPDRPGYKCWPDSVHGQGPLAGLATAVSRTEHDHVVALAVDQPFVRQETLRRLVGLAGDIPVVPVDSDGVRQVTCAVYPASISGIALEEANAGGSVQSLLDAVSFVAVSPQEWSSWGEDGRSWLSLDDPDAVNDAVDRYL